MVLYHLWHTPLLQSCSHNPRSGTWSYCKGSESIQSWFGIHFWLNHEYCKRGIWSHGSPVEFQYNYLYQLWIYPFRSLHHERISNTYPLATVGFTRVSFVLAAVFGQAWVVICILRLLLSIRDFWKAQRAAQLMLQHHPSCHRFLDQSCRRLNLSHQCPPHRRKSPRFLKAPRLFP